LTAAAGRSNMMGRESAHCWRAEAQTMRRATILALAVGLLVGLGVAGGVAALGLSAEHARRQAEAAQRSAEHAESAIRQQLEEVKDAERAVEQQAAKDRDNFHTIVEDFFPIDDPPDGDKDLNGKWVIVSTVHDGETTPSLRRVRVSFRHDTRVVEIGDIAHIDPITVDASKTPKAIDITPNLGKGKTIKGIYEVKGDELHICSAEPEQDRPQEFSAKAGSGCSLTIYKRLIR
jgi:uncharacterized protein (TIGR03067 family)